MISKKILIPIVIVVAVILVAVFLLSRNLFVEHNILLNETVTLTSYSPAREFYLSLKQGDKISIKVSVTGEPIDFEVYRDEPFLELLKKTDVLSVNEQLEIPSDGNFVFCVDTWGDYSRVHIIVTRV